VMGTGVDPLIRIVKPLKRALEVNIVVWRLL